MVLLTIFSFKTILAFDTLKFEGLEQPYYSNSDYEVWIKSIMNERGYLFLNLTIRPKINFRHPTYYKIKKSDRTVILNPHTLRITATDSLGKETTHPYVGIDYQGSGHFGNPALYYEQDYSHNLDKNTSYNFTLIFRENLNSKSNKISLLQDNEDRYFTFYDIPVSFSAHADWTPKNTQESLIKQAEESNDPICGVYKFDGLRFACIPRNNEYLLVCLDTSRDYSWSFGDVKAIFYKTGRPNIYKGTEALHTHVGFFESESDIFSNGDVLEIQSISQVARKGIPDEQSTFYKISPTNNITISNNKEKWSGTGFALYNGYIVTNNHVADGATDIEIFGVNGDFTKGYKAKVIGKDKESDLALLQIEDPTIISSWNLPPYSVNYTMADVGEDVFALGYPLIGTMGEEVKLTNGIISSRSGFEGDVTNYQISVPIQPGNSGGPMFNEDGELVGIICAKHEGAENAGYAIKTSYLKNLIESVASTNILPTNNTLKGRALKDQVKSIRNNVFLIKCSK